MKFLSMLTAGVVLLAITSSCRKEKADAPPPPPSFNGFNQKLMTQTSMDENIKITYNPDRTVKGYSSVSPNGDTYVTEFAYNGNVVTTTFYYNNKKQNDAVITLTNGIMTSVVHHSYDAQGSVQYTETVAYEYANGKLMKETSDGSYSYTYEYNADGNLVKSNQYNNGNLVYVDQYEYYLDKEEKKMSFNMMDQEGWGGLRPMFSKNLVKRKVSTNVQAQQTYFDGQYTYEFDADGYVLKGKWVNVLNANNMWEWTNVY